MQVAHSVTEVNETAWNELSTGRPFQSHRWYAFGERVMSDCKPFYLLAFQEGKLIGRATLWEIHNEPLPAPPGMGRAILGAILRRYPLLVCRSPLSNASGLILPSDSLRGGVLGAICESALSLSKQTRSLALMFDFLSKQESENWQNGFASIQMQDPGTVMQNRWRSMDEYLQDGNKKDRQHYKRTLREAEKLGITVERHSQVQDIDAVLALIHNVDKRYGNAPSPWMRPLLENLGLVNGVWLEAKQNGKLVGCGALLFDNETQLTTALGLADDVPYAYLMLGYASLEEAFVRNVHTLRWGSGAYDVKQNLGFTLEDNNYITLAGTNPLTKLAARFA